MLLNTTQGTHSLLYTLVKRPGANIWKLQDLLEFLITRGADTDFRGLGELTILQQLVINRAKVRVLLDTQADLDALTEEGKTALIESVLIKDFKSVKLLIREGADVNVTDNTNKSALEHAFDIHSKITFLDVTGLT